jgi:hypothetical protein
LLFPSLSDSVWWVSLCCLCMYRQHTSILFTPQHPFLWLSSFHWFPQTVPHILSCFTIIIIIFLGLGSTDEQEHVTFSLSSLAYLTSHYNLQFHSFSCKWHDFNFLYGWVIFHGYFLYPFISCWVRQLSPVWLLWRELQ